MLSTFAYELRRHGHDVRVVTALPNYPTGRIFDGYRGRLFVKEERDGIPVLRTWTYPSQSASFIPRLTCYLTFCASSMFALRWIGKPDIIFVDSPPLFLPVVADWISRLKGARWVLNVADLWPDSLVEMGMVKEGLLLRMARRLEMHLYRSADFVGAVTEGIKTTLLRDKGIDDRKIIFLPLGVDTDVFRPDVPNSALQKQYGLEDKSVFLFAGTLGHPQALPQIIEAAAILRERSDIALVFVGDGPVRAALESDCRKRGLTAVHFVDPVPLEQISAWYSIARAALVTLQDRPIFDGARPSKTLPPLACGIPVIYAGRGEMARIINDANAGIVVPPEQPEALADAIRRMADDADLARQLGRKGRLLCEKDFSWHTIVGNWLEALRTKTDDRRLDDVDRGRLIREPNPNVK